MKKLLLFLFFTCLLSEVFANATVSQKQWRWRNDNGNETTATWKAASNTGISISNTEGKMRLRISFLIHPDPNQPYDIHSRNISERLSYATSSTGPFIAMPMSGNNPDNRPFVLITSGQVSAGSPTSKQISPGTEPFIIGTILPTSTEGNNNLYFSTNGNVTSATEHEWVIQPTAFALPGTYYFRLDNIGGGYDVLPTIQVAGVGAEISGSPSNKQTNFNTAYPVDDQVVVTGDFNITDARVYIEAGLQQEDLLSAGTLPAGITAGYNSGTGALVFKGTASPAQWQAIFREVQFQTTSTNTADRTIKFVLADAVSTTVDGQKHYYQFFDDAFTWADAMAAAAAKSLFGLQGYLATITSQPENEFVKLKLQNFGWLAGTDYYQEVNAALGNNTYADQSASEGHWHWAAGPEKGIPFSYENNPVGGSYNNWESGEPNNSSGRQHYLQMYPGSGTWDDTADETESLQGFVVEYGFPNDQALAIDHSRTLTYYKMPTPATPVLAAGFSNPTNNNKPTIEGTTEADATVSIYVDNTFVTTVTADGQGKWSYTFTNALPEQTNMVAVTAADNQGYVSDKSANLSILVDTVVPVLVNTPSNISANSDLASCGAIITYTPPTATDNNHGPVDPNAVHVLEDGMSFYDYANQDVETQSSPGLPLTFNPTGGQKMAVFLVNGPTIARIYQDVTLPAIGPIVMSYDLQYNNHSGSFSASQFFAVEVRNAATNELLRTLFKTEPGDSPVRPMTSYSFDISEFAGQQVRLVLTDTNIQEFYMDVLLDNMKLTGNSLVNGSFEDNYAGWTISESGAGTWGIGYGPGITVTQTAGLASGALFPLGTTTNTFVATDAAGNTATSSFDVTIADTQAPVANAKGITVALNATGAATITAADINNNSTDNCGITSITLDKSSFDCSNVGDNTVTLTVTDASGNTATATAVVTVEDKIAPVAKAKDFIVQLDATGAATITAADINDNSTDNCVVANATLDKTSFDCSHIGANTVMLTVTDASGNTATATATVTVEDKIAPLANAKGITVALNATGAATITAADINNNSTDNCGITSITLDKSSFNCSNVGDNTVTLTVTDASGNTATATAVVTVEDKIAPVAKAKDFIVQLDATGAATITAADINDNSTDNCVVANATLDKTSFDCSHIGANTVMLTITDAGGNTATATATVTVEDKIAPLANAKDITVALNATGAATITAADINNNSTDNCGITSITLDKSSFNCSNVGDNTVTLTVTDASGNSATATAVVTVEDKIAPVAKAKDFIVQLDATGAATITAADINDNSTDNCVVANATLDKTSFDCSHIGANTVTLTVTDAGGNTATATATVTVEDKIAPVVLTKNITVQLNASNTASITAADINNGSADKCGAVSLALSKSTFNCSNVGANTVVLTVTDANGNASTATATVTVEDKIKPTITAPGALTVNVDAGKATASNVNLGAAVTADNCAVSSVTTNAPAVFPLGSTTVTWTVSDASGNTATATQIVTVRRNIVAYKALATMQVPIRTAFAITGLPATVEVTYSDNTKELLPVTWLPGSYNGFVAGNYAITGSFLLAPGTTNLDNVQARVTVEVQPNKVPTALALSKSSFHPNITGTVAATASPEAIGLLSTTDADDNQHVYTLVSGTGSTNNSLFEIIGNQLFLKSNNGLSGRSTFAVRVRTTDPYNNAIEQTFTLSKGAYAKASVELKIVNSFSPNGDGYNDKWIIPELRFYNNVQVDIFDRDGKNLFRSTDPEMGWDGKTQDGLALKGAVLYVVQIKDINLVKKGVVTILRK